MRRWMFLSAALLLCGDAASAESVVSVTPEGVSVSARAASLGEVLDRLGRQTGMKVVYEGTAPPRTLVTTQFARPTAIEAVLALLEGQGLNYALRLDASGTQVETLMMLGGSGGSAAPKPAPARAASPMSPFAPQHDAVADAEEESDEDVPAADQPIPMPMPQPGPAPEEQAKPEAGQPAAEAPPAPPPMFSVSPFAPQGPVPGVVMPNAAPSPGPAPSPSPTAPPNPET